MEDREKEKERQKKKFKLVKFKNSKKCLKSFKIEENPVKGIKMFQKKKQKKCDETS